MGITYWHAAEAERIFEKIADECFPLIVESGLRVEFLFRSEATRSGGKLHAGKCRKVGGMNAILSVEGGIPDDPVEPSDVAYAVIEIAHDWWQRMTAEQKEALVFHEAMHVDLVQDGEEDDAWSFKLKTHDLECFAAEVERYGLWTQDLQHFVSSTGDKLTLPFDEAPA